ncbi:DUF3293 domain-containing protein [Parapusillimonas sp. SGNA-6]|nr:DUF3293 domain-containing protein [Parapusillimonas sp. SGNA-6]
MQTLIPPSLVEAFHETRYTLHGPGGDFTMRIGQHSAPLQQLMTSQQRRCCALLTAYNPGAQPVDAEVNMANQRRLKQAVSNLGLPCCEGENVPAGRDGPVEPSLLILGLDRQGAYDLALSFRQLAFVYADERAIPELVWVDLKAAS